MWMPVAPRHGFARAPSGGILAIRFSPRKRPDAS